MRPVDPKLIDALRFSAIAIAFLVAAFALFQYLSTGRPDAREMLALGLLVALELAVVPVAVTFLLPRAEPQSVVGAPLPRGTSVPNPWSY